MKIYTKTGDNRESSLLYGQRISKTDLVFDVLGELDELSASLGFVHIFRNKKIVEIVMKVQRELFEIGSIISTKKSQKEILKNWENKVVDLEKEIDYFDSKNDPLHKFILPGGSRLSAHLHLARVICRRLERDFLYFSEKKGKNTEYKFILIYLNRLSDLLFVMARFSNKKLGIKDVPWK